MKNLLAIESATDCCSVALLSQGNITQTQSTEPRSNARLLLPMVDSVMSQAGLGIDELSGICVTRGPGSFTGIRIAMSVVQGLAYGCQVPILTWSSLELIAAETILASPKSACTWVAALDARMDEIYWASYRWDAQSALVVEVKAPTLSSKTHFIDELHSLSRLGEVVGLGSGFTLLENVELETQAGVNPQARTMLRLFSSNPLAKTPITNPAKLEPLYLRNEITWKKRERIRQ